MLYSLSVSGIPIHGKIAAFADRVLEKAAELFSDKVKDIRCIVDMLSYGVLAHVFSRELAGLGKNGEPENLILFLKAGKEYPLTAKRLGQYKEFIREKRESIDSFTGWFLTNAQEVFAESVTMDSAPASGDRWNTHPAIFYLNLTGAELMNRVDREIFLKSDKKVVFVPDCLCSPDEEGCLAGKGGLGKFCIGCTAGCPVSELYTECVQHDVEVILIEHTSSPFATGTARELLSGNYGAVGIACAAALLENGWRANIAGLPLQYLPLNNPACCNWFDSQRKTGIDREELLKILDV